MKKRRDVYKITVNLFGEFLLTKNDEKRGIKFDGLENAERHREWLESKAKHRWTSSKLENSNMESVCIDCGCTKRTVKRNGYYFAEYYVNGKLCIEKPICYA